MLIPETPVYQICRTNSSFRMTARAARQIMNLWRLRRRKRLLSELNNEEIITSRTSLEGSIDCLGGVMHLFMVLVIDCCPIEALSILAV